MRIAGSTGSHGKWHVMARPKGPASLAPRQRMQCTPGSGSAKIKPRTDRSASP